MFFRSRIVNQITLALLGVASLGVSFAGGQVMTISARPGLVNYFEGDAFLNGTALMAGAKTPSFVDANDTFTTKKGKAEILLMPGSFLRIGNNVGIRMVSASLVTPRFELVQGEAMVEVVGLLHGSQIEVVDQSALVVIEKDGLYRFTGGGAGPTAAVIEGSAQVTVGERTIKLGKGRQIALVGELKSEKFNMAQDDYLYAWSSVRSQYEAAASYDAASQLAGGDDAATVGWYFNSGLDCWAWLPDGKFFSPFGWGFYSPVVVGGATVVRCPVLRGGHWHHRPKNADGSDGGRQWVGMGTTRPVAIDPKHPPALQRITGSPATNRADRSHGFKGDAIAGSGKISGGSAFTNTGRVASKVDAGKAHTGSAVHGGGAGHGSITVHTASHVGTGGAHTGGGGTSHVAGGGVHAGGGGGGHAGGGGGGHAGGGGGGHAGGGGGGHAGGGGGGHAGGGGHH